MPQGRRWRRVSGMYTNRIPLAHFFRLRDNPREELTSNGRYGIFDPIMAMKMPNLPAKYRNRIKHEDDREALFLVVRTSRGLFRCPP